MVEYSERARAEVRARQKFFWNQKLYEILYLLHTFDFFISFKFIVLKSIQAADFLAKKSAPSAHENTLPLTDLKSCKISF